MTKKFNEKQYQGKLRVYPAVARSPNVRRLYIWDHERSEYIPNSYEARRWETKDGIKRRVKRSFETLQSARDWQADLTIKSETNVATTSVKGDGGPTLVEIRDEWKRRRYPKLAPGTTLQYERMLQYHFEGLLPLGMRNITSKVVDDWLEQIKSAARQRKTRRLGFEHELTLLGTLLNYYAEYYEDPAFRSPLKARHWEAARPSEVRQPKQKDLPEAEFLRFREKLLVGKFGDMMASLATVQYYQALRISEAAALYWEDVFLEDGAATIYIRRYVFWPRRKGMSSEVRAGFKNAKANGGLKELPLMPEAAATLKARRPVGQPKGLVFAEAGVHLEYRSIQHAYDRAFKAAGLNYTATHVMRHGGARRVLNQTGDLSLTQQLLGNTDMRSTLVYAQRDKAALRAFAQGEWENHALVANGRKLKSPGKSA